MSLFFCKLKHLIQVIIEIIICINVIVIVYTYYNSSKITSRFVNVTVMIVQCSYTLMELLYLLHLRNIIVIIKQIKHYC